MCVTLASLWKMQTWVPSGDRSIICLWTNGSACHLPATMIGPQGEPVTYAGPIRSFPRIWKKETGREWDWTHLSPSSSFRFSELLPSLYNSGNWARETGDTCSRLRLSSWKSPEHKSLSRALLRTPKCPGDEEQEPTEKGEGRMLRASVYAHGLAGRAKLTSISTPAAWTAQAQPSWCLINQIHLWAFI